MTQLARFVPAFDPATDKAELKPAWVAESAPVAVPDITFVGAESILATSAGYRVTLNYA